MPLNTQIVRNNQPLRLRWGGFHIAAIVIAAAFDSGQGPFKVNTPQGIARLEKWGPKGRRIARRYPLVPFPVSRFMVWVLESYPVIDSTPMGHDGYVLTRRHQFIDCSDGEILDLLPGDVLTAYRSY